VRKGFGEWGATADGEGNGRGARRASSPRQGRGTGEEEIRCGLLTCGALIDIPRKRVERITQGQQKAGSVLDGEKRRALRVLLVLSGKFPGARY